MPIPISWSPDLRMIHRPFGIPFLFQRVELTRAKVLFVSDFREFKAYFSVDSEGSLN